MPPPEWGDCTAQSRSETEPRRRHRPAFLGDHLLDDATADPGGATAWQEFWSEWVDPFGPIWVYQGPNCPQIKLMVSPRIPNLIYKLTTIFLKTFTATCSGASIASSGELPANFRRTSDEPSAMLRRTSGKLLDLQRSTWRVLTSFFGKLLGFSDLFP